MRRAVILCGTASFVMAFLGAALAFNLLAPSSATALSSQLQEVRASAFTLVGPDGTVLAELRRGVNGNGNLTLYDAAGTRRLVATDAVRASAFNIAGPDGEIVASLQRTEAGNGNLTLYNSEGTRRTALAVGTVTFFDAEGSPVFRAGRAAVTSREGFPPVNGVLLGPGGSISMQPSSP